MRRFGRAVQRAARQTSAGASLDSSLHYSPSPVLHRARANDYMSSSRVLSTFERRKIFSTQSILEERKDASSALPIQLPAAASTRKRQRPSRVTDLYDALVYEGESKLVSDQWRKVMAVDRSGEPMPEIQNDRLRDRLESCRETGHAEAALHALEDVERQGYLPSARAVIMAIEACIPAEEFVLAQQALSRLDALPRDHPVSSSRLFCSAKTLVAVAYTSRGRYEDALRIMELKDYKSINWNRKERIQAVLEGMSLGRDTIAWGVIVKALTKLGLADSAVDVVNVAMSRGIGMTDSLLHLTIDALRASRKWKEAEWLFDSAVAKGIQPRERTVASMLLTLVTNRDAKKTVSLARIEELVDMVEDPTPRFLSTALLVLTKVGSLERSEKIFAKLVEIADGEAPDELAFASMMAAYSNYVDLGWEPKGAKMDPTLIYEDINCKADALWQAYMAAYRNRQPSPTSKGARIRMLANYVHAKTRCFKTEEAVSVLEDFASNADTYPWFKLKITHMTTVLGAIELSCDVVQLRRLLGIMETVGMKHDVRSLAFSAGTYLGDGNLAGALSLVRKEAPRLLATDQLDASFRIYHWLVFQRRLEMLLSGLRDAGVGTVKDLDLMISMVKARRAAKE